MPSKHHRFSPSQLERIAQCPSSWKMAAQYKRTTSAQADEGTALHAVMAARLAGTPFPAELSAEHRELCETAWQLYSEVSVNAKESHIEKYIAWYAPDGTEVTGGTPDLWWKDEDGTIHLLDWKFGRNAVSADCLQFSAYSRMICEETGADRVIVHVVMPRLGKRFDALWQPHLGAIYELDMILQAAERPGLHLQFGPECQYCPAAHACPECRQAANTLAPLDPMTLDTPEKLTAALDAADEAEAIVKQASNRIKEIHDKAAQWLTAGNSLEGWTLTQGRKSVEVSDIARAFELSGLQADRFMRACKVSLPQLAEIYADVNNTTPSKARKELEQKMCEALAEKRGEPSVKRV